MATIKIKKQEKTVTAFPLNRDYKLYSFSTNTAKQNCQHYFFSISFFLSVIVFSSVSVAQTSDTLVSTTSLKKLSLEELMNIEVTSVSKHPEKLREAASAIQVITQEDIRQSGAKTLPEALRLASNLQVAQVNSSQWSISARGFDNVLANKLLVLIDGRTVYTPTYGGVYWDVQNVLLEDVDRIEVISGPGGTLWGANAVNGVINIITKNSKDTKGLYAEVAGGSAMPGLASLRYGGKITDNLTYRVYGTGFKMGNTFLKTGENAKDEWTMGQGGFRMDWDVSKKNQLSLQSDVYSGKPDPDGASPIVASGENIIAKWNHKNSEKSDFQLQAYYDHTWRDLKNGVTEDLKTYDIDWQNRYQLGKRHVLTYGLGARLADDKNQNLELFAYLPAHKELNLYSAFLQDEIMLIKERLRFIIGSKIEHNSYTGFEYEPNVRLALTPTKKQTIWAAVSRAVRMPSRTDRDFTLFLIPTLPLITGSEDFVSETLLAYELGWRLQPYKKLSISLSTFYNVYDDIRSATPGPPPFGIPITFANNVKGETYGAEFSANYQLTSWWHLKGGYTFLKKNLWVKEGTIDLNAATAESEDPQNQFLIQSTIKLPGRIELSTVFHYVDVLPKLPNVLYYAPSYSELDIRVGWKLNKMFEFDIVGQNLLDNRHVEFVATTPVHDMERSVYGKIICRF